MMNIEISRAARADIEDIIRLLSQVLEVHHSGRPDIFKTGATKYTQDELENMRKHLKEVYLWNLENF